MSTNIEANLQTHILDKYKAVEELVEIKNKLLSLKQQLQATTAELLTTITIDPEQTVQGRTVKLSNQALRDSFIAENTATIANDINESYKKLNKLQSIADKESDMILFYDIITRNIGKRFESFISIEIEKAIPTSIVIPLKDLTISTQFTDIIAITSKYTIGIECKVTGADSFKITNVRQLVKLRKLIKLNKHTKGYFIVHLAYDTELLLENVRVVNVGKDTLKLLKWEEFINEIKDK